MTPIRRRPCADPGQKQVPGEWMTQKGIDSSRPVTEASCAHIGREYAHEYSQRGRRDHPTFPHAMVLTAYTHSPRRSGFLASVACGSAFRKLDASVEASGPHDLAVRFSAVRYRHLHVHRIPSRVRDDREPPLRWDGTV